MTRIDLDDEADENLVNLSIKISASTRDRLKKIAKNKKTKVASILRQLTNRYVGFGVIAERRREHSMPRPIVKILFSELTKKQMNDIEEIYYLTALSDLKARYTNIDCGIVESALMTWARFNDLHFNIEPGDKNNEFWILCQHAFGKNWAVLLSKVITRLLQFNQNCLILEDDLEADDQILRIHYRIGVKQDKE